MHRVWKKFIQNHKGNYNQTLSFRWDFPIRTRIFFACLKIFQYIYSYRYLIIYFLLKCMRQAQGNNLCAYYVCENMHNRVGPRKSLAEWQQEVSRKLVNISRRCAMNLYQRKGFWWFKKPCEDLLMMRYSTYMANSTTTESCTSIIKANMIILCKTCEALCIFVIMNMCM